MQNEENVQALRQTLDFIRMGSIVILLFHFYVACKPAFDAWGLHWPILDRIVENFGQGIPLLRTMNGAKLLCLSLLGVSMVGQKGKKDDKITLPPAIIYTITGLLLYFLSSLLQYLRMSDQVFTEWYISLTAIGYLAVMTGVARMVRLLRLKLAGDVFNEIPEQFPQEERLLENEFSVNLPTLYNYKGKERAGWINLVNPARALMVAGTPGSGKSFWVVNNVIAQTSAKGYTQFVYDFKFPDLTKIAYNTALKNLDKYSKPLKFYVINFDDLGRSHRCNLISPDSLHDITDATESSRSIMLGLNKAWVQKIGDFWVESPINFITALIWYLRKYQGGKYCTLPHVIELAQVPYDELFPVLALEGDIDNLMGAFNSAYTNQALEQLEGQIASAKIGLARLSSPSLYYILSGSDFTLDLNNPEAPKIVAVGNNPSKTQIYGAVISLCVERMLKLVNRKGQLKSALIFDEFPTIYAGGIDSLIATARSNRVSVTLTVQDLSQLRKDYGREQAEVIMNVCGNLISGQVLGDTAKLISDRIGRIMQERESVTINSNETSFSKSTQLEAAIPPSRISSLSAGEFVGAVADDLGYEIKYKAFHCRIQNDMSAIKKEQDAYKDLPVIRNISHDEVSQNFHQIKKDVKRLVASELEKINTPTVPAPAPAAAAHSVENTSIPDSTEKSF